MVASSSSQDELEGVASSTSRRPPLEEAKQKRLNPRDIVNLSLSDKYEPFEKTCKIDDRYSGNRNRLGFCKPGFFLNRFQKTIPKLQKLLDVPLEIVIKKEECEILLNISKADFINDIEIIMKNISLVGGSGIQKLRVSQQTHDDPFSYVINKLPKSKPTSRRIQYLTDIWPIICKILAELDAHHHPGSTLQHYYDDSPGQAFIK
ncbi:hypothetical protein BDA99DRAFT_600352 [Phascolomyces articulosus]|uniref:Uncharacterized protein n=1 Tax=Phascolomyces articulosus TaxID=60185 RepID=A0AAD5PJH1_9FUNG|nr:hypothetical protein BDA99DRAFT_600352 [Phascolomyces articulosus]